MKIWVKAILVVVLAKIYTILVPLMIPELITGISILAVMMGVIIHLKKTVMFDDPINFFGDVGTQN